MSHVVLLIRRLRSKEPRGLDQRDAESGCVDLRLRKARCGCVEYAAALVLVSVGVYGYFLVSSRCAMKEAGELVGLDAAGVAVLKC